MSNKIFAQAKDGRNVSLNLGMAEAITHVGGDDYLVTINGNNHRIYAPNTNLGDLHNSRAAEIDKPAPHK